MQKNKTFPKIIAVNPGWRYLGIVIFEGSELREWRLKSLTGKGAKEKMEKAKGILTDFIERYDSNILAIKKLHSSRTSANLTALTSGIKDHCRRRGLKIFSYTIREMKETLSSENQINKKDLAELLAAAYPALIYELAREKKHNNPYYIRLFEAAALGHVCLKRKNHNH